MAVDIATLPQQCLVFVQNVLGIHSHLAATAGAAGSEFNAAGYNAVSQPQLTAAVGDIVQFQPGQFGVGSAGHVGIISSIGPNGARLINANWGPGTNSGPGTAPSFLDVSSAQLAKLTVYEGPSGAAGQTTSIAQRMAQRGASVFSLSGSSVGTAMLTSTGDQSTTTASGCEALGSILQQSGASGFLGGVPIVGTVWTAATTPEKLIQWAIQPCVRWRIALGLGALVLVGLGLSVTFRKEVTAVVEQVGKSAEAAAA